VSRSHSSGAARHVVTPSHASAQPQHQTPRPGHRATPQPVSNHALGATLGVGTALDPGVRADMESRFGENFFDVRIHDDEGAHRAAAALEAKAYTHGGDVAFAEGRYRPQSADGKRLLAHELAHVVQQRRGGSQPALDQQAPHELAADQAAGAVAQGAGPVAVAGATAVGVAREPDPKKRSRRDDESGPVRRVGRRARTAKAQPKPVTITDPKKAIGVLGEVTTPFDLYSDPSWNNLGGGAETASSRQSLARETRWGDTGGFDTLVENRKTGRLVIGEQKRLGTASFSNATATTTNLEKNIANTVKQLRAGIKSGRVHPGEVANVENVIARLEQTGRAVKNQTSLPEEVVFELTATGGKSTRIGKDYISKLGEKYKPEFVQKLLERTYIRDPQLAKAMGRDPSGKPGTKSDPHVVPAKDAMTPDAKSELERLLAGKTPKEWKKQKLKERQTQEQERKRARDAERKAEGERRAADRAKAKAEAKEIAEQARQKKLEELREAATREGPEAKTKAEKRLADNALKKQATQAGKEAQKKYLDETRQRAKAATQKARPEPVPAKPQAPEATAPKEAPAAKVVPESAAPTLETVPLEVAPKGLTPKGAVKGAVGVAGVLAGVSSVKDIAKDVKAGHYWTAAGKTGLMGLSFVGEAAPPLFAFGAIMNYWGPRHGAIQKDSFDVGDVVAKGAGYVPLLGRSETFRDLTGGAAAATVAVGESIAYTVKDMGVAVVEGAETLGGLAEDAFDWLTDGPSMIDIMRAEAEKRRGGD
jgi:Domain of unknown function (DUF4157)